MHKLAQPAKHLDCTHAPSCPAVILIHGTLIHHKNTLLRNIRVTSIKWDWQIT